MSDFKKVLESIKDLNTRLSNIEASVNASGLGEGAVKQITRQDINNVNFSGFRYLASCNINGVQIPNGYLLQIIYKNNYKVQFYIKATNGVLQYRELINGIWEDFINV